MSQGIFLIQSDGSLVELTQGRYNSESLLKSFDWYIEQCKSQINNQ